MKISFAGAVKKTFNSWRDYRGASDRREYWFFMLFLFLLFLVTGTIDNFISRGNQTGSLIDFTTLVQLVIYVFWIPLVVRRYHDAGVSGFWQLLDLAPVALLIYKWPTLTALFSNPLFIAASNNENLSDKQLMQLGMLFIDAFGWLFLTMFAAAVVKLVLTLLPSKQPWQGNHYVTPREPEHLWGYVDVNQNSQN